MTTQQTPKYDVRAEDGGTFAVVDLNTGQPVKGGFKTYAQAVDFLLPSSQSPAEEAEATAQARVSEILTKLNVKPPQGVKNELRAKVSGMLKEADELELENVLASLDDDDFLTNLYIESVRGVAEKQAKELKQNFNDAYQATITQPLKISIDTARAQGDMTGAAGLTLLLQDVVNEQSQAEKDFAKYYFQNRPKYDGGYAQTQAVSDFLMTWAPTKGRLAAKAGAEIGQQTNYEFALYGINNAISAYAVIAQQTQRNVDQMRMDLQRMVTGLGRTPELRPVLDAIQEEADGILKDYSAVASKQLPQDYLNMELPRRLQFSLAGEMGALNAANIVPGNAAATVANLTKGFMQEQKDQFGNTVQGALQGKIAPPNRTTVETAGGDQTITGGPKPGQDPFFDDQLRSIQADEAKKLGAKQSAAQTSGAVNQSVGTFAASLGIPQESVGNANSIVQSPVFQGMTPAQQQEILNAYSTGNYGLATQLATQYNPSKTVSPAKAMELNANPVAGAVAFQAPQNQATIGATAQGNVNSDLAGSMFALAERLGIDRKALEQRLQKAGATTYATDDSGGVGYNYHAVDAFPSILDLTPDEDVRDALKALYKPGQPFQADAYKSLTQQVPKYDPIAAAQKKRQRDLAAQPPGTARV